LNELCAAQMLARDFCGKGPARSSSMFYASIWLQGQIITRPAAFGGGSTEDIPSEHKPNTHLMCYR